MKLFKQIVVLLMLMTVGVLAQASESYRIFGDISGLLKTGEVILTKSTDVIGGTFEINRGKVVNGRFSLKGPLDEVDRANLSVIDATGERKGGSAVFVLEAGDIEVTYHGKVAGLTASGGHYNQLVVASWEQSDDYQAAVKQYSDVLLAMNELAESDADKKRHCNSGQWIFITRFRELSFVY